MKKKKTNIKQIKTKTYIYDVIDTQIFGLTCACIRVLRCVNPCLNAYKHTHTLLVHSILFPFEITGKVLAHWSFVIYLLSSKMNIKLIFYLLNIRIGYHNSIVHIQKTSNDFETNITYSVYCLQWSTNCYNFRDVLVSVSSWMVHIRNRIKEWKNKWTHFFFVW